MRQRGRGQFAILRCRQVQEESGYPRSTLYLRISQGLWPKPVQLGPRMVGWPAQEVEALNAAMIAGQTESEIRTLVRRLESARTAASRLEDAEY
jgi:prophage regulatory protein